MGSDRVDATEGVTEQDKRIAVMSTKPAKASVLVINKWDLVEKDDRTMNRFTERIRRLGFMQYTLDLHIGPNREKGSEVRNWLISAEQQATRITTGI